MGTVATGLRAEELPPQCHDSGCVCTATGQKMGKKTRVRACVHAPVPGPWRAARPCSRRARHVRGRARVPAGSPGAGACAVRGLGVFLLNTRLHLPWRFGFRESPCV